MKRQWVAVGLLLVGLMFFGVAGSDYAAMKAKAIEYRSIGDTESPRQPDQLIKQVVRDMVPILA